MTPGLIVNYCPSIATRLGSNSFIAYMHTVLSTRAGPQNRKHKTYSQFAATDDFLLMLYNCILDIFNIKLQIDIGFIFVLAHHSLFNDPRPWNCPLEIYWRTRMDPPTSLAPSWTARTWSWYSRALRLSSNKLSTSARPLTRHHFNENVIVCK